MTGTNQFWSDAERLEAIRRTEEETRPPKGVDMRTVVSVAVEQYHRVRPAVAVLLWDILKAVHFGESSEEILGKKINEFAMKTHFSTCTRCRVLLCVTQGKIGEFLPPAS